MADKKMELIVKVNVSSAGAPVAATSVNTVGFVVTDTATGTEPTDKKYTSADEVKEVFGDSSEAYSMAARFFAQDTQPASVRIVVASAKTKSGLETAMGDAAMADVYHFVVVLTTPTDDSTKVSTLQLLKDLNAYAAAENKFVHTEFNVATDANANAIKALFDGFTVASGNDAGDYAGLKASKTRRVAVWCHNMTANASDHIGVSITSDRCGVDPARGTWAHKEITGDSPDVMTRAQLSKAIDTGYNVYTDIAGSSRIFLGTTCGPTDFIDTIIKSDWVKFRVQEAVFKLLQTGNEGYGIDMGDDGIAAIGAEVSGVLTTAYKNHYIMDGYTVSLPAYADIPAADKSVRKLSGIRASMKLMDSVHTVLNIDITAESN